MRFSLSRLILIHLLMIFGACCKSKFHRVGDRMTLLVKRIFAVEDNLEIRVILQIVYSAQGVRIEFDRWGHNTVSKLNSFAPVDVILLDLMFPDGTTGYEIFDTIRSFADYDHVPIVAVSASDPTSAIPLCKSKGFAGFIG